MLKIFVCLLIVGGIGLAFGYGTQDNDFSLDEEQVLTYESQGFTSAHTSNKLSVGSFVLDDDIKAALNRLREKFPHGIPELGIPVLDPYHIQAVHIHRNIIKIIKVNAELSNLAVIGASTFILNHASLNILGLHFDIDVSIPKVIINGDYTAKGKALGLIPFSSTGNFSAEINDARIIGKTKLSIRPEDDTLYLEYVSLNLDNGKISMNLRPRKGIIMKQLIRRVINSMTPGAIAAEKRRVETELSEKIIKMADEKLKDYTLETLLKKITELGKKPESYHNI